MQYLIHRGEKIPLIGFGTYRLGITKESKEADTFDYNNMKNVFEPVGKDDIIELEKKYPPPTEKYPLKKI